MKVTDLRIGNYHNYLVKDPIDVRKQWNEVCQIDAYDLLSLSKDPDVRYQPIPLTEEWLLKFGFTSEGEGNEAWLDLKNEIENNKIQLRTWVNFECFEEFGGTAFLMLENYEGVDYTTIIPRKFQYVHQLQNLYFALTGEELSL